MELASRATTTTVWIGWDEVSFARAWSGGVIFLLSHDGAALLAGRAARPGIEGGEERRGDHVEEIDVGVERIGSLRQALGQRSVNSWAD